MTNFHDLWTTDGIAKMLIDALMDTSTTTTIFESSWAVYDLFTAFGYEGTDTDDIFGYFIKNPDDELFHLRWHCST
jgi:hypothetical protein